MAVVQVPAGSLGSVRVASPPLSGPVTVLTLAPLVRVTVTEPDAVARPVGWVTATLYEPVFWVVGLVRTVPTVEWTDALVTSSVPVSVNPINCASVEYVIVNG